MRNIFGHFGHELFLAIVQLVFVQLCGVETNTDTTFALSLSLSFILSNLSMPDRSSDRADQSPPLAGWLAGWLAGGVAEAEVCSLLDHEVAQVKRKKYAPSAILAAWIF